MGRRASRVAFLVLAGGLWACGGDGETATDLGQDPGTSDPGTFDPGPADPGMADPGGTDLGPADAAPEVPVADRFSPPAETATFVYRVASGTTTTDLPAKAGPVETWHGREYRRLDLGDFTLADPTGVKAWANYQDNGIEFGGAEVYVGGQGNAGKPMLSYVLDQPIQGRFDGEVGKTYYTSVDGHLLVGGGDEILTVQVSYQLVATGQTAEVPYGSVKDCLLYHLVITAGDLKDWAADFWVKSGVGLVKATSIPGFDEVTLVSYTP